MRPRHSSSIRLPWHSHRPLSRCDGFTMLELLIVLVLMLLITATVLPRFSQSMAIFKLQKSTREVAAVLNEARNTAISQSRNVTFGIDSDRRIYSSTATGLEYPWPNDIEIRFASTVSGSFPGSISEVIFYPDGSTSGAELTIAALDNSYSIAVDWITGRVNVHK